MGQTTLCDCGAPTTYPSTTCTTCLLLASQRSRQSRSSDRTPSPATTRRPRHRDASTSSTLHSAFTAPDEQPPLFPPSSSLHRQPPRSLSRPRSSRTSISGGDPSSPDLAPRIGRGSLDSARTGSMSSVTALTSNDERRRAATPEVSASPSRGDDRARTYSPMSAGFARLNARDVAAFHTTVSSRKNGSVDLGSRMFGSPA